MINIDEVVDEVSSLLFKTKQIPSYDKLLKIAKSISDVIALRDCCEPLSKDEIEQIVLKVQIRHDTTMGLGIIFEDETCVPWLDNRNDIDFYYWGRYEKLLKKKLSEDVVLKTDKITSKILDRLADPHKEGAWERRGLVVGHVQSGKTANYIGVMCKAADAIYYRSVRLATTQAGGNCFIPLTH